MKNKTFISYGLVFLVALLPPATLGAVQRGGESSIQAVRPEEEADVLRENA